MKKTIIKVWKYAAIYIISMVIFITSLSIICLIPSENIKENVKKSSEILIDEGNYKICYIFNRFCEMKFDNYSDSLMINNAYSVDNEKAFESAMLVRKNYINGITKKINKDSNGELKSASKYEKYSPISELQDTVNNDIEESFEYARYWHGYLLIIRPLLLLFDIGQIRIIFTIILIILAIILLYLIAKKINIKTMIFFLVSLIFIEYFYIGQSLQGTSIFIITMIASIIILIKEPKLKNYGIIFFTLGIVTNFFDFLTQPIISLFVPLIIYFLLKQKEDKMEIKESLIIIIKYSLIWVIGYLLTWVSKWILVDILYNRNLILSSIIQVKYRAGDITNIYKAIISNVLYELGVFKIILTAMIMYLVIKKLKYGKKIKWNLKDSFPYIVIGVTPFIWFSISSNHSYEHYFFTYRTLIITLICIQISATRIEKISN
ncbi:MAG: hypothetical protein J6M60_06730 [Clostridia bacterium]|nr:hypothetical protein [Clostridia bacterium]